MIFEICVDSVSGVRAARRAGAQRVELCADLLEGGITPSLGMIRQARAVGGIGLHVMIRPRGGDFLFDPDEFAIMRADVELAKREGADGVVIGLLKPGGAIDAERTGELSALARPMAVTFHRAFDMTPDPIQALETLIGLGIEYATVDEAYGRGTVWTARLPRITSPEPDPSPTPSETAPPQTGCG